MTQRKGIHAWFALAMIAAAAAGACNDSDGGGGGGAGGLGGSPAGSGGEDTSSGGTPDDGVPPFEGLTGAGLELSIDDIEVASNGTAKVDFTITDADGRFLDLDGFYTEGAVEPSFVLSWLGENSDGESTQYTAYTLRTKEGASGESAVQSSTDQGGSFEELSPGKYRYTFGTKIEIDADHRGLTHTLGVYATREVGDVEYVATAIESWVPAGGDVKTTLDVVTTDACNQCHTRIEFHGGARRGVEMCQLCHTEANSINPESGNTIDFQVMIHKIHRGADLPSVLAGDPYYFVGYGGRTIDYSDVAYPWDMRGCETCHQGEQGDRWLTRPAQKPCSSCHDRTYFGTGTPPDGWTAHSAGPRKDSECIVCHASDSLEPIDASHYTTLTDPNRPEVVANLVSIANTAPGQKPQVRFNVTIDGAPRDLLAQPIDRVRVTFFGPTTDIAGFVQESAINAGVPVAECTGTPTAPCLQRSGTDFIYYANWTVPASAKGSYNVGLEGRHAAPTGNVAFTNPVLAFAVTGGGVVPRREIVSLDKCNSCHGDLNFHGGGRKEPQYCVACHNPNFRHSASAAPAPGEEELLSSLNFKDLIHGIHSSVRYPSPLNNCSQCHLDGTAVVPLDYPGLLPSEYATYSCDPTYSSCDGMGGAPGTPTETEFHVQPESAACTSCHNDTATIAHAETNTGMSGEACGTCHREGKSLGVDVVHALDP